MSLHLDSLNSEGKKSILKPYRKKPRSLFKVMKRSRFDTGRSREEPLTACKGGCPMFSTLQGHLGPWGPEEWSPKDVLASGRDFADEIKLRVLRWGRWSQIIRRAQCTQKHPCKLEIKCQEQRKEAREQRWG